MARDPTAQTCTGSSLRQVTMLRIGSLMLLACMWPYAVSAQTLPIRGRVSDSLGGAINGAVVTLGGGGLPNPRGTRTGVDGTFSFDAVPQGSVTLQVDAPGFERWTQTLTIS